MRGACVCVRARARERERERDMHRASNLLTGMAQLFEHSIYPHLKKDGC